MFPVPEPELGSPEATCLDSAHAGDPALVLLTSACGEELTPKQAVHPFVGSPCPY